MLDSQLQVQWVVYVLLQVHLLGKNIEVYSLCTKSHNCKPRYAIFTPTIHYTFAKACTSVLRVVGIALHLLTIGGGCRSTFKNVISCSGWCHTKTNQLSLLAYGMWGNCLWFLPSCGSPGLRGQVEFRDQRKRMVLGCSWCQSDKVA